MRRSVLNCVAALAFGVVASCASVAQAASYPGRSVTLILGQAAGGSTDIIARLIGKGLSDKWGQPVIVDNRAGAAGTIAAGFVARAPADGYTILFMGNPHTILVPGLKLEYDPAKSFKAVTELVSSPDILVVNPNVPANSLGDLIQLAKSKPHQLNYGSPGTGTLQSLAMRLFMAKTGIDMVEVPFNGGAPALVALQGGEIQVALASFSGSLPLVQAGKLRALAVSASERSAKIPNVPTIAEAANLPGFHSDEWFGALVPAGTPQPIVQQLHDDMVTVLNQPDVQARLQSLGFTTVGSTPDAFAQTIATDMSNWSSVQASVSPQ